MYHRYKNNEHPAYKKATKEAKKKMKRSKREFEKKLSKVIKKDNKSFAYIRSRSKSKIKIGPLTSVNGEVKSSPAELSEELNEYLSSVFTQQDKTSFPSVNQMYKGSDAEVLQDVVINCDVVDTKLSSLREDKTAGVDGRKPRFLKAVSKEICRPLTIIFRKILDKGAVPDDWRTANVSPIFKKGNKGSSENYRPVGLTSQVCKLFESIIRDAVMTHLESNNLIKESQHGFRHGRSCLNNLSFLRQSYEMHR